MMFGNEASPVICVVGPTASGKSALAQSIALSIGGEVVSADSMQIYRGMDIGTGKVLPDERLVPHYGLDLVEPGTAYSAALFQKYARDCFKDIHGRGKRSVLAGGTGLYVRAAIDAYEFPKGDQVDNPVREKYSRFADDHGPVALWEKLKEVDPESASILHPNNVRRVIRAFELLNEGTTYAQMQANLSSITEEVASIWIGLAVEPSILCDRINSRVDSMMEQGLVDEVKILLSKGFRNGITAPQAIGYKEIVAALDGACSLHDAVESIKQSTRRYAKRQRTWFRRDSRIHWLEASQFDLDGLTRQALEIINA